MHISINSLSFSYDSNLNPLFENLSLSISEGWTGIVGANGLGKSTLLKILSKELKPTSGGLSFSGVSLTYLCWQETLIEPMNFFEFQESFERHIVELKSYLELHEHIGQSWAQLSHGERKRFQIACALSSQPDLLLVDEPTNHLDQKARDLIIKALKAFKGIGVLVSHDRKLLDALLVQTILFEQGKVYAISGNYSQSRQVILQESIESRHQEKTDNAKSQRLKKEILRLKNIGRSSDARLSKKNLGKKDHDAKSKIDGARITGKDASLAGKVKRLENRLEDIEFRKAQRPVFKDYSDKVFFKEDKGNKKVLLDLAAQTLSIREGLSIEIPALVMKAGDKIGISGINGVGKSSFLKVLSCDHFQKHTNILILEQEISKRQQGQLIKEVEELNKDDFSHLIEVYARLGSNPKSLLSKEKFSPGELRKLVISLAIMQAYDVLLLDEPDNHLDLPALENLGQALSDANISLIMISHDELFIQQICDIRWDMTREGEKTVLEVLSM